MSIISGRRGGRLAGTDPTADALRSFLHTDLGGLIAHPQPSARNARPARLRLRTAARQTPFQF